ncbi:MAG: galactose-1-phosphate uridylyltransferase [bacterium]|nr:galactose-1-phosphate uridylyltransferase [bacterium]
MAKKNFAKFPSELRQEPISQKWVVIATGRGKRPEMFKKDKKNSTEDNSRDCPFCDISTQEKPVLILYKGKEIRPSNNPKNWTTIVFPNKFPAFLVSDKLEEKKVGPYTRINGAGYHEVVATRDHKKSMGQFSASQIKEVIDVYQKRYLDLADEKFVNYIHIFHNHGHTAGASISHPHSQIITTPVSEPELHLVLKRLENYYQENKKCLYCEILEWERKEKKRIVFENKEFVVLCPYASRSAFETRIYPKNHEPYFERITEKSKNYLAQAFKTTLYKIYKGLNNPDYNFFLHTAPCDEKEYQYYHWHFEFFPKTSISAGFELGAKIHVSSIEPEKAAEFLRKIK